jgi:RNA polymerase sigma factor (sigma-70 family)
LAPDPPFERVDPFVGEFLRERVRRLAGRRALTAEDLEDLHQDLCVAVVQGLPAYDPAQGDLGPFLRTVLNRRLSNWLRRRLAKRRDPRGVASLSDPVRDAEGRAAERAETLDAEALKAHLPRRPRDDREAAELRHDVDAVLRKLSPQDRALADRLTRETVSEAARSLGVARPTLAARARRLLRAFEKENLRELM